MSLAPFLFDIKSHEPDGSRHSLFAYQDISLDQSTQILFTDWQSHGLHGGSRELYAQHLPSFE